MKLQKTHYRNIKLHTEQLQLLIELCQEAINQNNERKRDYIQSSTIIDICEEENEELNEILKILKYTKTNPNENPT